VFGGMDAGTGQGHEGEDRQDGVGEGARFHHRFRFNPTTRAWRVDRGLKV